MSDLGQPRRWKVKLIRSHNHRRKARHASNRKLQITLLDVQPTYMQQCVTINCHNLNACDIGELKKHDARHSKIRRKFFCQEEGSLANGVLCLSTLTGKRNSKPVTAIRGNDFCTMWPEMHQTRVWTCILWNCSPTCVPIQCMPLDKSDFQKGCKEIH